MKQVPFKKIETVEQVEAFFRHLMAGEGLNLHPDTPFGDYVDYKTGRKIYTTEEAKARDTLMEQAFAVCEIAGVDIYGVCIEVWREVEGLEPTPEND